MRKLTLALVAVGALLLSAPTFVSQASAAPNSDHLALSGQTKKVVKTTSRRGVTKRVVIKRDSGMRRGRAYGRRGVTAYGRRGVTAYGRRGVTKRVVVKKRPGGTVVKKTTIRR